MGSKVIRNVTKVFRSASGVLFGRSTGGTGRGEEIAFASIPALIGVYTTAQVDSIIGGIEGLTSADIDTLAEINAILTDADLASITYVDNGLSGKQATLVSGTNIKTVNSTSLLGSGDITVGLSGTGSVDNAALRADGTGGATLQNSSWVIADNATASPNNTVNHASLQATGSTTNVSVSLVPKGTGATSLQVPDGAATGGNARGSNAVDLQTARNAATQVASGSFSSIGGGSANSATGTYAVVSGGANNTASGGNSPAVTGGNGNVASADYSRAGGLWSVADQVAMDAWSGGGFANFGVSADTRIYRHMLKQKTTSATPVRLQSNGINQTATYTAIPSGRVLLAMVKINGVKSDGSACAEYVRKVAIKNVGGTTSLVGSVETIGTDIEDNASTDVVITADNTNDALDITVTGIAAETWRWVAVVEGLEIVYGT